MLAASAGGALITAAAAAADVAAGTVPRLVFPSPFLSKLLKAFPEPQQLMVNENAGVVVEEPSLQGQLRDYCRSYDFGSTHWVTDEVFYAIRQNHIDGGKPPPLLVSRNVQPLDATRHRIAMLYHVSNRSMRH